MVFLQVDKNYVIWKKNVHKKIEKFAKNYMYLKKKTFSFAALPLTSSTSTNKTHEKL